MLLAYGKPFRFSDPGMAIKFYPSKYPTHFAIGAALEVRKLIADSALINAVNLITPAMPDVDRPEPVSGLEGKFSFQYTAAAALLVVSPAGANSYSGVGVWSLINPGFSTWSVNDPILLVDASTSPRRRSQGANSMP